MNHELNDLLKSVLQEALEPMNQHLKRLENELRNNMEIIRDETKNIKENMATKSDIERLGKSLDKSHMESLASDELILKTLKEMNSKLDAREYDVQALNKRVFKVESEIERLTRL